MRSIVTEKPTTLAKVLDGFNPSKFNWTGEYTVLEDCVLFGTYIQGSASGASRNNRVDTVKGETLYIRDTGDRFNGHWLTFVKLAK